MANRRYYQEQFSIGKIVAVVLALIILVTGVCCLGYASRNDEGKWFGGLHWSDKTEKEPEDKDNPAEGSVTVGIGTNNRRISLARATLTSEEYEEYGIDPQAENAFTLSATLNDEDGNAIEGYQAFTFAMSWADESKSESVSDYMTMTTTDTVAAFVCEQAFDTQILVTITSVFDESVFETATLDFAPSISNIRIQGLYVFQGNSGTPIDVRNVAPQVTTSMPNATGYSVTESRWSMGKFVFCTATPNFGVGSIENPIDLEGISVTVSLANSLELGSRMNANGLTGLTFEPVTYTGSAVTDGVTIKQLMDDLVFNQFSDEELSVKVAKFMSVWAYTTATRPLFEVNVTVPLTYGDDYTFMYRLSGGVEAAPKIAGIELSDASFIFHN